MNERGKPVAFVGDVPKTWVLQGVEALANLLQGNLVSSAETPLYLPQIEFYERILPQDPALGRIGQCWLRLERERFQPEPGESILQRLLCDPWDSKDPRIKAAWESLTAPENESDLKKWAEAMNRNPLSRRAMEKPARIALQIARERSGRAQA